MSPFFYSIVILLLSLVSADVFAGSDYNLSFGMRSRPFGLSFGGEWGYNQMLWGTRNGGSVLYGFVRPVLKPATSVVVNGGDAILEVYPISFLRLSGGYGLRHRMRDAASLPCSSAQCTGVLGGLVYSARLLGGYSNFIWAMDASFRTLNGNSEQSIADESSVLVGGAGSDQVQSFRGVFGYRFEADWLVGTYFVSDRMKTTGEQNHQAYLTLRHAFSNNTATVAVGTYASPYYENGLSVMFLVDWVGAESLQLR